MRDGNTSLALTDVVGSSMVSMLILAIALAAVAAAGTLTGAMLGLGPAGWAPVLIVLGYLSE